MPYINNDDQHHQADRMIRIRELVALTGLSRSTVLRLEGAGLFPRRKKLAAFAVGWSHADIQTWISERVSVGDPALGIDPHTALHTGRRSI